MIMDERTKYQIIRDIYAILAGTPPRDYKACIDDLLGRDSEIKEIDEQGIELTAAQIKIHMKNFKKMSNPTSQKKLMGNFVSSGPIFFCKAALNGAQAVPVLIDTGASNSTISRTLLDKLNITLPVDRSFDYTFQNCTEESSDLIEGSAQATLSIKTNRGNTPPIIINLLVLQTQLPYMLLGSAELRHIQAFLCFSSPLVRITVQNVNYSVLLFEDRHFCSQYPECSQCDHSGKTSFLQDGHSWTDKQQVKQPLISSSPVTIQTIASQLPASDKLISDNINSLIEPTIFTELSEDQIMNKLDEGLQYSCPGDQWLQKVNLPPELSAISNDILALLKSYSRLHPVSKQDVGLHPTYSANLKIKNHNRLPKENPRQMSEEKRQVAASMEEDLLRAGVIRFSDSPYSSNILITEKSTFGVRGSHSKADAFIARQEHKKYNKNYSIGKKYRFTVDFRSLNRCLEPPPRITLPTETEVSRILRPPNTHLLSLDIANAFHSIAYKPDSCKYTAFWNSSRVKMEFLRTPQGVSNSPFFFSDATRSEFTDTKYKEFCTAFKYSFNPLEDQLANWLVIYCDDLMLAAHIGNAIARLHYVLYTLKRLNLKTDFGKLLLFTKHINFLGTAYNISSRTHRIKPDRKLSLLSFRQPPCFAELLSPLASFNYTSPYLVGLKLISLPLLRLLAAGREGQPWRWELVHTHTKPKIFTDAFSGASHTHPGISPCPYFGRK